MAINVITNLKIILLIFALCALLFLSNTQATTELYNKCEKKFWYKNLKDFKKSIKSECLKENHHHEKRHRQYHICNDKSYDKDVIASKWKKFSNCRCQSALVEMSNFKESNVFVCYQIANFDKVTGNFIGEMSIYKKNSEDSDEIAVKFSSNVEIMNDNGQWNKYDDVFYRTDKINESKDGKFSNVKYYITGKISKSESMNKVSMSKISPTEFQLTVNDKSSTLEKKEFAIVPFSKFVPSGGNFLEKSNEDKGNGPTDPSGPAPNVPNANTPDAPNAPGAPGAPNANAPGAPNAPDAPGAPNAGAPGAPNANAPGAPDAPGAPNANAPGAPNAPDAPGAPGAPNANAPGAPNANAPDAPNANAPDAPNANAPDAPTNPTDPTDPTDSTDPTDPTDSSDSTDDSNSNSSDPATPAKQVEANNENKASSTGVNPAAIGSIVFGVIIAIGGIFIGCNTYERLRWRRQYRRRQAAEAQQNSSLANVPDYNGYGRAY